MSKLQVLDLFSGIGGFSLGLERTGGFETVAFCEIEPFPRAVLAKHWPEVPCYEDVRGLTANALRADGISGVDVITGGFPCQDLSVAGRRAGIVDGSRSGLWSEITRLVGELRPRFVIVENVANLLSGPSEQPGGWFGRVLGDLAELGYDAEWENIPSSALGAPHRRERVWLVAYTERVGVSGLHTVSSEEKSGVSSGHSGERGLDWLRLDVRAQATRGVGANWKDWLQPRLVGLDDGLPTWLVRGSSKAYGNSIVPRIPELIGRAILESEREAA